MAKVDILLQGLQADDHHEAAVNKLLALPNAENILLSVAFVRRAGVDRIRDKLSDVSGITEIFLGIRNGVTSVQGILSLLEIGTHLYVVDTASQNIIFHPKLYMAYNNIEACIIIGSANLTLGGLMKNIEFSTHVRLNRRKRKDEKILQGLKVTVKGMLSSYPNHVFRIQTKREAVQLLREGRLEDERASRFPNRVRARVKCQKVSLAPIPLNMDGDNIHEKLIRKSSIARRKGGPSLVWISKPLTERSLNIPKGKTTHPTGGMSLGKGQVEGIDFQKYFRNEVFSELSWKTDSSGLEKATANFEIIVAEVSYGHYDLQIKHNPSEDTKTYEQRNSMTSISWGNAKNLVANESLLGRTLYLYKMDSKNFLIDID